MTGNFHGVRRDRFIYSVCQLSLCSQLLLLLSLTSTPVPVPIGFAYNSTQGPGIRGCSLRLITGNVYHRVRRFQITKCNSSVVHCSCQASCLHFMLSHPPIFCDSQLLLLRCLLPHAGAVHPNPITHPWRIRLMAGRVWRASFHKYCTCLTGSRKLYTRQAGLICLRDRPQEIKYPSHVKFRHFATCCGHMLLSRYVNSVKLRGYDASDIQQVGFGTRCMGAKFR